MLTPPTTRDMIPTYFSTAALTPPGMWMRTTVTVLITVIALIARANCMQVALLATRALFLVSLPLQFLNSVFQKALLSKKKQHKGQWLGFEIFRHYYPQKNHCEPAKLLNTVWPLRASGLLFLLQQSFMGRRGKYSQVMCFLPCHWCISVAQTVKNRVGVANQALASQYRKYESGTATATFVFLYYQCYCW